VDTDDRLLLISSGLGLHLVLKSDDGTLEVHCTTTRFVNHYKLIFWFLRRLTTSRCLVKGGFRWERRTAGPANHSRTGDVRVPGCNQGAGLL